MSQKQIQANLGTPVSNNTQTNSKKSSLSNTIAQNAVKKKRQVTWKEEFQIYEVDNWKEFNILNDDNDKIQCKCSIF
ncbi:hypothetical protein ABPG72_005353 [Tetrahymena utriculariae]